MIRRIAQLPAALLGAGLLLLLLLPGIGLLSFAGPGAIAAGLTHASFLPALWLSLRTSLVALAIIAVCGTPLAWWLSRLRGPAARLLEIGVDLPIVVPPAVLGVALLLSFGRQGLLGPVLTPLGLSLPFTTAAVILAQVVVSAPFYVTAATAAFRAVDPEMLDVARSLGASPAQAVWRVAMPVAAPGLIGGLALAWARALGEFGATLLFAGNLEGVTQTLPLAIYTALEADVGVAVTLSLALVLLAAIGLFGVRSVGHRLGPRS